MDTEQEREREPEPRVISAEDRGLADNPPAAGEASPLEAQDWKGETGRRWLAHLDPFEAMVAPVGAALIETARFASGERVIDVGCGAGASTLVIARRVSPRGLALGLDLSPALVEAANQRAARPGAVPSGANVRFIVGDAATAQPDEEPFDVLFSRFGLSYFEDPYRAFEHIRGWLKPKGRAVFSCWAPVERNPWVLELDAIVRRHIATPPLQPNAPGPFALADVARLNDILVSAGFVDIEFQTWRGAQPIGGPGANAIRAADFVMSGMHVSQLVAGASDEIKGRVRRDVEALLKERHGADGVALASTAWLVTARNGARA